jgi:hypothetical protein
VQARTGVRTLEGPYSFRDLARHMCSMDWRRVDERSDGSLFDPEDEEAQLAPPEASSMMAFLPYSEFDDEELDEDRSLPTPLLVPVSEKIMANKRDANFMTFMRDWLGREPDDEDIVRMRTALFAAYRPEDDSRV